MKFADLKHAATHPPATFIWWVLLIVAVLMAAIFGYSLGQALA